jgi:hypothetical protein
LEALKALALSITTDPELEVTTIGVHPLKKVPTIAIALISIFLIPTSLL